MSHIYRFELRKHNETLLLAYRHGEGSIREATRSTSLALAKRVAGLATNCRDDDKKKVAQVPYMFNRFNKTL